MEREIAKMIYMLPMFDVLWVNSFFYDEKFAVWNFFWKQCRIKIKKKKENKQSEGKKKFVECLKVGI